MVRHEESNNPSPQNPKAPQSLMIEEVFQRFFNYDFWGFWGKLYHRSVFVGIYFPKYTINEDYVVMLQLFLKEKRIAYVNTPLYHYLIHPNSLSHQKISKRAFDEYYNKLWAYNFCIEHLEKYSKHAEAQLTESCIKLLRMISNSSDAGEYLIVRNEMKSFLQSHFLSIICNKHLLLGLKKNVIREIF